MPEILTESFCERCGTRYTFESAAPRAAKLSGIKVLSRGLKNFVMSDDTSMDEAMAAARSETDREVTSQQLDAFHKTFNFCMTCRQYTCGNCWNETEGRCLTCAPHLGHEIMPAPFPDMDPATGLAMGAGLTNGANGSDGTNGHAPAEPLETLAWPTMDLDRSMLDEPEAEVLADAEPVEEVDAIARLAALGAVDAVADDAAPAPVETDAEPAEIVEAAVVVEAVESVAPVEAADSVTDTEPEAPTDQRAAAAASQTNDLMQRFRPGQSLDAEIEAFEAQEAEREHAAQAAAVAAAAAATAAAAERDAAERAAAEQAAARDAADREAAERAAAIAAAAALAAAATPEPEPAPRVDVVEQPTWRIVAPEPDATPAAPAAVPDPAVAPPPVAQGEPQWPTQPEWPSQRPVGGLPYLNRPSQPTGGMDALWAESAREVANPASDAAQRSGGVEPCVSCGLSLSATARFCRRCGTRQG